ncbi:RsmB/NOP family class I SAM-dependent RNA methyltransferase [Thalassorhabdomicrobium marinisediminis]|uniref:RsmB/NOP family class I SAM-dependent RNA methyltransferase n=1 Tax=Thalassorhabdomicrobium marinisediminis TaxID=2170577 RepID=UPI00249214C4|nr:RsmB/NOP family class I SAM-dependent RNA methyltransferase [Thalassorhabdomicrobium marinisediminis]
MTPAARVAAAIEVLDDILGGAAPEKALTSWGRGHRFAGSKDRAAIRDHVFQALRCRASYGWLGGSDSGRGLMLGAMRAAGQVDAVFTGEGHAPAPVSEGEAGRQLAQAPRAVRLDVPDWLLPKFDAAFGAAADEILSLMQDRAGLFLRVNTARATRAEAQAALAAEGIATAPVDQVNTALHVTENERKVAGSQAYCDGLVEVQDVSSQVAMAALPVTPGMRVLDYCAGGGGKALALAARGAEVTAHDIDPRRMADIAPRAVRAGVTIARAQAEDLTPAAFDLVLCDAPCSGSGTWRRTPAAKWALTEARLAALTGMQDDVLRAAAPLVAPGGLLAYATCSVFAEENAARIEAFLSAHPAFTLTDSTTLLPRAQGDGFYYAVLRKAG